MNLSAGVLRAASLPVAERLGYRTNPSLPIFDGDAVVRSVEAIGDRLLCLNAVVAAANGFPKERALSWIDSQRLAKDLSSKETLFLSDPLQNAAEFFWRHEAMFALAWSVSIAPLLDMGQPCPSDFVTKFPDLKINQTGDKFRQGLHLRPTIEIAQLADLSLCLHWSIRDAVLNGHRPPGNVAPSAIAERRLALEWLFRLDDWDHVELDT